MKKVVIGSLLAVCVAMADDSRWYVGLEAGNTDVDLKASANGASSTDSDDAGSIGLEVGKYIDDNSRAMFFYNDLNVEDATLYLTGLGYDYLIGESDLKPFVGAAVGYGSYEVDDTDIDLTGFVFGLQAGLNYRPNQEPFSIEVGYRFLKSTMKDTVDVFGLDVDLELDNFATFYLGVDYRF